MKKTILTTLLMLFVCLSAAAGDNTTRLQSGTLSPLKGKGGTIHVIMDFSRTRANRKPLEQYITEDYGSDMETFRRYEPEMLEWFCERWNDDIEEGPRVKNSDDAKFTLNIVIKTLQLGTKSGWAGSSISGYAEFYRTGEEEPFAKVEILKSIGTRMGSPIPGFPGLKQVFSDLAENLCDLIYHN